MRKIGIINCYKMSKQCSGINCFRSLQAKTDAFAQYDQEGFVLLGFGHCNECCQTTPADIQRRGESLRKAGVTTIHLGSCIKLKCPNYGDFMEILSKDFTVAGQTHALPGEVGRPSIQA